MLRYCNIPPWASAKGCEAAVRRPQLFCIIRMKTNVYVDGFNLYFGCLRGTPYRWLDLAMLCRLLLPAYSINRIRYFTALVKERPHDPQQPQRQRTYIRALETLPNLVIHYGQFLTHTVPMRLERPLLDGSTVARVVKTEEKGTDVNLATRLIFDIFDGDCDIAVLISNDSDLVPPIQALKERFGTTIGILNPHARPSRLLRDNVDFLRPIRRGPLSASQFPPLLHDSVGAFSKPAGW